MKAGGLGEKWGRVRLAGRRLSDPRERMWLTAALSFLVDLLYALYHGALGLREGSAWLLTLCVYYSLLGAVRFGAVFCGRKEPVPPGTETFVTALSGGLLVLLSAVLAGVSYLSLAYGIARRRDTILMITIATYTFTKLGFALRRAVKWRGDPSRLLAVIRTVGYAELAASVFTMQRSMIASFSDGPDPAMELINRLSGAALFLFVLTLGISLLHKAKKGSTTHGKVKPGKSQ